MFHLANNYARTQAEAALRFSLHFIINQWPRIIYGEDFKIYAVGLTTG
jgi:hypothetical protein